MRTALLGLAVWFALVLYASVSVASTLDGCREIANLIVCEPGARAVIFPT
jgi:hypothetical protein